MRSVAEITESIQDKKDEIKAFKDVAEREQRELTPEQKARVMELIGAIKNDNSDLEFQIEIEKQMMSDAESRIKEKLKEHQAQNGRLNEISGESVSKFGPIRIPAKAKNHGELRAYQGPDAERDAYIAGNVILAAFFKNRQAQQFCRQHGLGVQNTMVEGTDSAGGYVVPEEMSRTILRLREARGVFPRFANRIPMGSDVMKVPRLLEDVTVHWVDEATPIPPSDLVFGPSQMIAQKLGALTKWSTELDEDAVVEIGDLVTESMAHGMADKIDDAAFNGDGSADYGGFTGLANALHEDAILDASSATMGDITFGSFTAALGALPDYGGANPRWFMNRSIYYATIHRLYAAAGGNTNMTMANGVATPMIDGIPVEFVTVMPGSATAAAGDIIAYFGDLRYGASYGVRRSFRTQLSTERYFEEDVIAIKATERVGILIHENGSTLRNRPIVAIKLPDGGAG